MRKHWPFYVAKRNENVELACHMFGLPLKLTKDRKWLLAAGSGKILDNANNLDDANNKNSNNKQQRRQSFSLSSKIGDGNDKDKGWQSSDTATTTLVPEGDSSRGYSYLGEAEEDDDEDSDREPLEDGDGENNEANDDGELLGLEDSATDVMSQSRTASNGLDLVSIIFWFKDDNPIPIYTLDARQMQANSLIPKLTDSEQELPDKKSRKADTTKVNNNTAINHHHYHNKKDNQDHNNDNSEIAKIMHTNMQLLSGARHYQSSRRGDETREKLNNSLLKLDPLSSFPVIKLKIEGVRPWDSGNYKCRVDFRRSSTISQIVRLLVEGK